ncbi:MAG: AAA family ATPase [Nitrososphaeria archaeon]
MVSIIISGMAGVGKSTVAAMISKELGMELKVGGDLLKEYAKNLGFTGTERIDFWDTEEGKKFLELRTQNELFDKELDAYLNRLINQKELVITSWSLPWISEGNHVKVWLKASQQTRARRISKRDSISLEKALEIVKTRDEENYQHYKKLYGIELDKDLSVFNVVIDTEYVDPATISKMLIAYYRSYKMYLSEEYEKNCGSANRKD